MSVPGPQPPAGAATGPEQKREVERDPLAYDAAVTAPTNVAGGGPVAGLRASWRAAAASAAFDAPELERYLDQRLDQLDHDSLVSEGALIDVVDEVLEILSQRAPDLGPEVGRRLMRSIYEFLLALDAATSVELVFPTSPTHISLAPLPTDRAVAGAPATPAAHRAYDEALKVPALPRAGPSGSPAAQVDALLRGYRFDDAASLLMRLARSAGGEKIAALAIEAGDLCRDGGAGRAAAECYLAASTCADLEEAPLWRLAELSVDRSDPDLALSYLDRIAALARWRGDVHGVAVVYRKMSMIAPGREDIRASLFQIEATGQLD